MNNTMKEYIAPSLVLVIICLVITAALAGTYQMTKPVIDANAKATADAARTEVLADADSFTEVTGELSANVVDAYTADNGAGTVITTVDKGFGGQIKVMTGFDKDGKITGIKVLEQAETPGLGTKAQTPEYLSQYTGQNEVAIEGGSKNIDAVTGATVTSKAVFRAVETAVEECAKIGGAA